MTLQMRLTLTVWIVLAAVPLVSVAQESTLSDKPSFTVGIALPVNVPEQAFNPQWQGDQLIRNLKNASQDPKVTVRVNGLALHGSTMKKVADEALNSHCQFVVLSSFTIQENLVNHRASSGVARSERSGSGNALDLSVQYSITRTGEAKPLAHGSILTAGALDGSINDAMRSALNDLATRVVREIEKQSSSEGK
jgi:hypothetical protein